MKAKTRLFQFGLPAKDRAGAKFQDAEERTRVWLLEVRENGGALDVLTIASARNQRQPERWQSVPFRD